MKETLRILLAAGTHEKKEKFYNMRPHFWIALMLVMATFAVYSQVKDFDFVDFDDQAYVTQNPKVQAGLTIDGIKWAFRVKKLNSAAYWQPLTWISHMFDIQFYGLNPGGHHLSNLWLHILNVLLLFMLLNTATGNIWPSALVAGIFALHPLNVESVAWVAERKNILSTFFWLLTMLAYVAYAKRPGFFRYLPVFAFFVLGLMSKPMLVTLPFVLLLMDFWPLKRIGFMEETRGESVNLRLDTFRKQRRTALRLIMEKAPLFLLATLSIWISLFLVGSYGTTVSTNLVPFGLRVKNALVTYIKYLGRGFWPQDLAVFYPYPQEVSVAQAAGSIVVLAGVSFWTLRTLKSKPYLAFGWFWFLGTLVPVIGLYQAGLWPEMADRWAYVPLIGLVIMAAWGLSDLSARFRINSLYPAAAGFIILATFAAQTYQQVQYWQNSITLFQRAVNVTKNNAAFHSNLANVLMDKSLFDKAVLHYQTAIRIKPDFAEAHNNLGVAYTRRGEIKAAIKEFNEAIRIHPEYVKAHNNLGATFLRRGNPTEAIKYFRQALAIDSGNAETHNNLGLSFIRQGALDKAIYHFKESVQLDPKHAGATLNLELSIELQKKIDTAIDHFEAALRSELSTSKPADSLARIKTKREQLESAVKDYQKTLSLQPGFTTNEFDMKNYPKFYNMQKAYK